MVMRSVLTWRPIEGAPSWWLSAIVVLLVIAVSQLLIELLPPVASGGISVAVGLGIYAAAVATTDWIEGRSFRARP